MKTRLLAILVIVGAIGAVAALSYRRVQQAQAEVSVPVLKPAVVRVEPLTRVTRPRIEAFYGFIEANARVDMAFQIPGRLAQLGPSQDQRLRENDQVYKGDLIATLELERFEARLAQAEARVAEARAAVSSAQAGMDDAAAQFRDASREYDRVKQLVERKVAHAHELEKVEVTLARAQAMVDAADASMEAAKATYAVANADTAQARIALEDASLRAPFNATVAAIPTELGAMIQPSQPVVTLVDLTTVRLVVGVTENKVPLLKEGQVVEVEVMALRTRAEQDATRRWQGRPLLGRVKTVPPAADRLTRLFNVEIELDNPSLGGNERLLKPGMVAKAKVYIKDEAALSVPTAAAVRVMEGKLWAYFVTEGYQVGLDMGTLGRHEMHVPTSVAQLVAMPIVETRMDGYVVTGLPEVLTHLVVEGQSRLTDGQPVIVVGEDVKPDGAEDEP